MPIVPRNSRAVPDYTKNNLSGLTINNNVTDANNDIDIAVGSASDSTNTDQITLSTALTKRLDANWVAGTNQGGLDTGAKAASTTYHVFVIRNTTTAAVDVLFSTSATSPTMPSGYQQFRRIASIMTDGSSNILGFVQNGDSFIWNTVQMGASQTNVAVVTNTLTSLAFVPTGIRVRVIGNLWTGAINNQSTALAWVSSAGQNAPASDTTAVAGITVNTNQMSHGAHTNGEASANWHQGSNNFDLITNTSGQLVLTTLTSIGGNVSNRIRVIGWIDTRGKVA